MNELHEQVEGQNNFPVWVRISSLFIGILLMGDGMRRFIRPKEMSDLYSYLSYIIVGAVCLLICGYSRRLFVSEEGLVRETNIWGRKRKEIMITWDKIERVIYSEQKNAFIACFERGNKGYRITVDLKNKEPLRELIQYHYNLSDRSNDLK